MSRTERELKLQVRIFVEPDGDEFYAHCPDLKGVHINGETEQEAVKNCLDAIEIYVQSMLEHGDELPDGLVLEDKTVHVGRSSPPPDHSPPHHYTGEFSIAAAVA